MKITIDISDFYLDQESEIEPALKEHIKLNVTHEIYSKIKSKVEESITKLLMQQFNSSLETIIQTQMDAFVSSGKIMVNEKEIPVTEHFKNVFMKNNGWHDAHESMKKLASAIGNELKNRYDLMFATQIVAKLNDQGMLKEDIAKLILPQQL